MAYINAMIIIQFAEISSHNKKYYLHKWKLKVFKYSRDIPLKNSYFTYRKYIVFSKYLKLIIFKIIKSLGSDLSKIEAR